MDGLESFRAAARATDEEEVLVRKEANARIAILERARAHAYRRLDFMSTLIETAQASTTHDEALAAQRRAVLDRFGWTGFDSGPRRAISEAVTPLLTAVASIYHQEPSVEPARAEAPVLLSAGLDLPGMLASFEMWYRDRFGSEFWALADHFFPDTPLVDF